MIDFLQEERLHLTDFSGGWSNAAACELALPPGVDYFSVFSHVEAYGPTPFASAWDVLGWVELFLQKQLVARLPASASANDATAPSVPLIGPDNQTGSNCLRLVFCNAPTGQSLSKSGILRPQFAGVEADSARLNLTWKTPVFAPANFTGLRAYLGIRTL